MKHLVLKKKKYYYLIITMSNLKVIREYCSWLLLIVSVIVPHV